MFAKVKRSGKKMFTLNVSDMKLKKLCKFISKGVNAKTHRLLK